MNDHAVLADHPEALNALLLANVLNDFFCDVTLVQQHRVAGAGNYDISNLRDMARHHGLQVLLPVLEKKQRRQNGRHRKSDEQIGTDFKPEIIFDHLSDRRSIRIPKIVWHTSEIRPFISAAPSGFQFLFYYGGSG